MSVVLSSPSNPGQASWNSATGSIFGDNVFGFDGGGGTIFGEENYSFWCTTNASQVNVTVGVPPVFAGQRYSFNFTTKSAASNVVVTFPASLNSAGNTVVTMNDAGDSFVATGVATSSTTYRWVITANNGCTLS